MSALAPSLRECARSLRIGLRALALPLLRERRCPSCLAVFQLPPPACEPALPATNLCPSCAAVLKPLPPGLCPLCAMPQPAATAPAALVRVDAAPHPCPRCLLEPPPWSHLACATLYADTAKSLLLRYKFGNDWALTPVWGQLLAGAIRDLPEADMLIPMPQHPRRLRWRGANPIHEVTRQAGHLLGLPVRAKALRRTRPVRPQEGLSARQRWDNPKGSFAAQGVQGCRVILVDDVLTTGATLRHAGQCLRDAGASALHVAVIARTPLGG